MLSLICLVCLPVGGYLLAFATLFVVARIRAQWPVISSSLNDREGSWGLERGKPSLVPSFSAWQHCSLRAEQLTPPGDMDVKG